MGIHKSVKGESERRFKELDQLSDHYSNKNSEENSSFTFNDCSKKMRGKSQADTPKFIDLTENEDRIHVEKNIIPYTLSYLYLININFFNQFVS